MGVEHFQVPLTHICRPNDMIPRLPEVSAACGPKFIVVLLPREVHSQATPCLNKKGGGTVTVCVGYLLEILDALLATLETCHLTSVYVALNPKP
jgi:hypothetical protein